MASKKTGRLAGLAALAGAAYMADKKGMFGGKGASAKADAKDTPADREDAEMGAAMRSNMAATPKMSPTSSGDLMSEKEPGWETKSAPTSVARPTATRSAPASRDDGGKSVVDRQNTEIKQRTGLSPADYVRSGKAKIDEQDAAGTAAAPTPVVAKRPAFLDSRPGIMERMREKDREMFKNIKPAAEEEDTTPRRGYMSGKMKKGGAVKKMASGGMTSSASKRGDGIATKGKTRGKMC